MPISGLPFPVSRFPFLAALLLGACATAPAPPSPASTSDATDERPAHDALVRELTRLRSRGRAVCIEVAQVLELDELEQDQIILQQRPLKVGLAAATRRIGASVKIFVVVVAEGAACR